MDNQTLSIKPKTGYGFVYCYTSPSGKRYIGKTKTTLKERAGHNGRGYRGCKAFNNAINKYGWENFQVEILKEVPIEALEEVETQYILDYDTVNPKKGYNIITTYYTFLSNFARIPVYSYDGITGNYVAGYPSMAEAERQMDVYPGSIRRTVNNGSHKVRGYIWRTEKLDYIDVTPTGIQLSSKHIYQYDVKTGQYITEFASIREAARETGFDRKTISDQVAQKDKRHGKYLFRSFKVDNIYDESSTTIS